MSTLKLNNVTALTESSGAITLANSALGTPTSVTLTNATFPSGHVIQTQFNTDGTYIEGTSSASIVSSCFCNITVRRADTAILMIASPAFYLDTQNDWGNAQMMYKLSTGRSGTVGDYTSINPEFTRCVGGASDNNNHWHTPSIQNSWTHGQSAGQVINIALRIQASSGVVASNNGSGDSGMTLMEYMP